MVANEEIGFINRLNPSWNDLGADVSETRNIERFLDCAPLRSK
jgi:hypothetical protein